MGKHVIKKGFTAQSVQRYHCKNEDCQCTFLLEYNNNGCKPGIENRIINMGMNGSGVRDTSRVLGVSINTVISTFKKKEPELQQLNHAALDTLQDPESTTVTLGKALDSELDEMWSYVHDKGNQRWLWHAIDHDTGKVLAYVFDSREDRALLRLKTLLEPFNIRRFYTDGWGAYERHLPEEKLIVGKINTQKIERKHLTFRTRIKRLARKTICFSKLEKMHDIVIGLFINRYEFGLLV
jgi:insertion element IS1 protein InsB